jgi:hypothetical protein
LPILHNTIEQGGPPSNSFFSGRAAGLISGYGRKGINVDELVKSPNVCFSVIPAKAGIQSFQMVINSLDSGFHRSDDFFRDHHNSIAGWKMRDAE